MPRNVYFSQAVKSEQNLYEDLIIESLKIYGQDVYYIPRTLVNRDDILNEDPASKFDDAYLLEMYIENSDGFEGAGDLYSKFGLEIRDDATFIVSRRRWESRIGVFSSNLVDPRPQEGDLIFLPMTNSFFEISYVEDDSPFYQLSMDINITGGNHYEVGETVRQTISDGVVVFGEVVTRTKVSDTSSQIYVANIGVTGSTEYKTFIESDSVALVGDNTGYIGYINAIYDSIADTTSGRVFSTDEAAQNMDFEIDADGFIDFSESNPFGDPSETY